MREIEVVMDVALRSGDVLQRMVSFGEDETHELVRRRAAMFQERNT